jgi:hypothetical protein
MNAKNTWLVIGNWSKCIMPSVKKSYCAVMLKETMRITPLSLFQIFCCEKLGSQHRMVTIPVNYKDFLN